MFSIFRRRRPEPEQPPVGSPEHRAQLVVDMRRRVAAILVEEARLERQLAEHRAAEREALADARSNEDPDDLYRVVTAQDAQRRVGEQLAELRAEESRLVKAIDEVRSGTWDGQGYLVHGRFPEPARGPEHLLDLGDPDVEARVRRLQDTLGAGD